MTAFKPNQELELFYSNKSKRMFISERVNITRIFEPDTDMEKHVEVYVAKVDE